MFCRHCGKQVNDTDRFCFSCGGALTPAQTPVPTASAQAKSEGLAASVLTVTAEKQNTASKTPFEKEDLSKTEDFFTPPTAAENFTAEPSFAPSAQAGADATYFAPPTESDRKSYDSNANSFAPSDEEQEELAGEILKYGILSLAFSCTLILALFGMIFGIVTKHKVNTYTELYGPVTWRSKVGKSLGKAGLIAGIVGTAYFAFYFSLLFLTILLTV